MFSDIRVRSGTFRSFQVRLGHFKDYTNFDYSIIATDKFKISITMKQFEFEIRTYGFGELAQLYFPNNTGSSASKTFGLRIHKYQGLASALKETGWKKRQKYFIPRQVKILVNHFDPSG